MKIVGIILLIITIAIAIPTRDKWSYKVMHDRYYKTERIEYEDSQKEIKQ